MRVLGLAITVVFCYVLFAAASPGYLDVVVFVDKKAKEPYAKSNSTITVGQDTQYIVSEIRKIFQKTKDADAKIELQVVYIGFLNDDVIPSDDGIHANDSLALFRFKAFLEKNSIYYKHKFDLAILFTGYRLPKGARAETNDFVEADSVCKTDAAIIVGFDGTATPIYYGARAISLALGLPYNGRRTYCRPREKLMMDAKFRNDYYDFDIKFNTEFSTCSEVKLKEAISKKRCLQSGESLTVPISTKPSADMLNVDKLCQRLGYVHMDRSNYRVGEKLCDSGIPCMTHYEGNSWSQEDIMAPPGLVCNKGKRCEAHECVKAVADFPVPDFKHNCMYGDGLHFAHKEKVIDCAAYFSKTSNYKDCNHGWFKDQCCETCAKLGDKVPALTQHSSCPTPDADRYSCGSRARFLTCRDVYRSRCCNYCSSWDDPDPLVG